MGRDVEWVPYGRPAAQALLTRIAEAKGGHPLAPVTVVVPSNHVGVATRRLLAAGRCGPVCQGCAGLASVTFVTPYRLAELLGAPALASAGRRPVSTPVIAAALRRELARDPGVFAPVADHPATEMALVAAYRELRDLPPSSLAAVAATSRRAADVVRLHRHAREWLRLRWYDEQDLIEEAVATLTSRTNPTAAALGAIIVYLPQRLSKPAAALLAAAAERHTLSFVAGVTGDTAADAAVVRSVAQVVPDSGPGADGGQAVVGVGRTRFVTTSDAEEEVRAAVRAVVDATRRGVPLDRIAILHASPQPYARLVHEHLAAAGIAVNGAAVVSASAGVAGRLLLQLLALPQRGFARDDVFAWLTAGPIVDHGRWAPIAAWERLSRTAGVLAGRREWDQRLELLAQTLDADAGIAGDDPDAPPWRASSLSADAQRARRLRAFVLGLIDELEGAAGRSRRWSEHATWATTIIERLLGGISRRADWPPEQRMAAERVERALARLHALDEVEGPVDLDVFARTLSLELDSDLGRVGRLGEGVLVGSVAMGVGLDLDLIVVLGLAEGTFPGTVRDDSLLPDHERQAAGADLVLRAQLVDDQHRQLLGALGGAAEQVLCIPRGDLRRSTQRTPSRWAIELASTLAGRPWTSHDFLTTDEPWIRNIASFDAGLRTVAFPSTEQEHRLRGLASGQSAADPLLERASEVVVSRLSPAFTRFDGNLSGLRIPSPVEGVTSATRLERWATCPLAYLLQDILRVEPVDNPEARLQISPLDLGSLIHKALERFFGEVLARPASRQPGPTQPWSPTDEARLLAIADELGGEYEAAGLTGKPIFWRRERARMLRDLQRFLAVDSEHRRAHRTRPVAVELPFGMNGSPLGPATLVLADGRSIAFRGKADRLDLADDGGLHVIDYKTGRSTDYRSLSELAPDQAGRKLQLAVYGAAAQAYCHHHPGIPAQAEYWFITTKGDFRTIGYAVTPTVLEAVGKTLATVASCIERGVFPARPTATATSWTDCEFCDPDGLGATQLRRQWERKRADPALAVYADLAEPERSADA